MARSVQSILIRHLACHGPLGQRKFPEKDQQSQRLHAKIQDTRMKRAICTSLLSWEKLQKEELAATSVV